MTEQEAATLLEAIASDTDEIARLRTALDTAQARRRTRIKAYLADPKQRITLDLIRATGLSNVRLGRIAGRYTHAK